MNRNSLMEISGRVMHQFVRLTLNKSNDDPMMQELHVDGMLSDVRSIVERVQHFGFTSTPLPRDEQQKGQGGGGSGGDQIKGPAAEAIAAFIGGQRNHPVVIAVDDRRHRPMGLKPGENAQYDDIGQMTLLRRTGLFLLSLDGDQSQQSGGGKDASGGSSSQSTERMVSIRHVEKQKQQRGKVGASGGGGSGGGSGGSSSRTIEITEQAAAGGQQSKQSKQDYKHEGETVNNEMRVTKKRIEFRSGDDVVGYYDKQSKTWCFIGKVKLGTESASHPVYGVNQGLGMTTDPNGSDAVLVNAPKPGPPTSQDERP
jgi:phage gp45-like